MGKTTKLIKFGILLISTLIALFLYVQFQKLLVAVIYDFTKEDLTELLLFSIVAMFLGYFLCVLMPWALSGLLGYAHRSTHNIISYRKIIERMHEEYKLELSAGALILVFPISFIIMLIYRETTWVYLVHQLHFMVMYAMIGEVIWNSSYYDDPTYEKDPPII